MDRIVDQQYFESAPPPVVVQSTILTFLRPYKGRLSIGICRLNHIHHHCASTELKDWTEVDSVWHLTVVEDYYLRNVINATAK